ncbi:MAG TPA: hypothetical protein VE825_15550 [Terriglobales bacterium]|jgi:hypothetical protein|nr:hypothetical protein [Terriglobales bacterium]
MDPSLYVVETFAPHLHSVFQVEVAPGTSLPFELTEVEPGPAHPRMLMFSLMFRGPADPVYPQGIYPMQHAALGKMDFFLVPVARQETGVQYQAVFNRMIKAAPAPHP